MKKILLSLVCLIAGWQFAFAEEPALYDTVRAKLDSIFEYVDKDAVPTGHTCRLRHSHRSIGLIQRHSDRL